MANKKVKTMIKDWKVWFKRVSDSKDTPCRNDIFSTQTRQEAKQEFRECYRHDEYIIVTVEEVTKENLK
jgi:hypothetical protein